MYNLTTFVTKREEHTNLRIRFYATLRSGAVRIGCWQWRLLVNGHPCMVGDGRALTAVAYVPQYIERLTQQIMDHHHTVYIDGLCDNDLNPGPVEVAVQSTNCADHSISQDGEPFIGGGNTYTDMLVEEINGEDDHNDVLPCYHKTVFNLKKAHIGLSDIRVNGMFNGLRLVTNIHFIYNSM